MPVSPAASSALAFCASGRLLDVRAGAAGRWRRTARARAPGRPAAARSVYCCFSLIELNEHLAGASRGRQGRQECARTFPSASEEIVTWSTAARVPTTSTERFDRIAADFLDLNRLRRRLLGACLCRFGARAGPATRGESKEDKETNEKRHRVWARAVRARERAYEGQDGKSICGTSQPDRSGDYRSPASTTGSADAFQPPPSALIRRTLEDSRRARSVTDVRWLLSAAF